MFRLILRPLICFFRHFDSQQLVVREGHLLDDKHSCSHVGMSFPVPVSSPGKLDSLGVGGLGEFLVNELYPDLIDVETDVRLVLYGKVYEEVVPDRVYMLFRRITIRCALVATF